MRDGTTGTARGTCATLVLAAALLAGSARAVTVGPVPADTTVGVGDFVDIRIVTGAFPDLKAFSVIYRYDPTILQLIGATPGDVLNPPGTWTALLVADYAAPADSASYDAAMLTGATQGPGILNFFRFKTLAEGVGALECRLVDFRNSQNQQTLPACTPGRVVVVGPTPALPASWGRIKALYR